MYRYRDMSVVPHTLWFRDKSRCRRTMPSPDMLFGRRKSSYNYKYRFLYRLAYPDRWLVHRRS